MPPVNGRATSSGSPASHSGAEHETPVLQVTNLHGDIIATAYFSETATALASSADTSEYRGADHEPPAEVLVARRE